MIGGVVPKESQRNCQKFEVNQIPLLGITEMDIMNLVEKLTRLSPSKGVVENNRLG